MTRKLMGHSAPCIQQTLGRPLQRVGLYSAEHPQLVRRLVSFCETCGVQPRSRQPAKSPVQRPLLIRAAIYRSSARLAAAQIASSPPQKLFFVATIFQNS
jgi:hypothetical protein